MMDPISDPTASTLDGSNIQHIPDDVLSSMLTTAMGEMRRRSRIRTAWNDLNNCLVEYQKAIGAKGDNWLPGQTMIVHEWQKPVNALEAYCVGDRVAHDNATWESMQPVNLVEPGTDGDAWWMVDSVNNNLLIDPNGGSVVM